MAQGGRGHPVHFLPKTGDNPCSVCGVPSEIRLWYIDDLVDVDMCFKCAGVDPDFPTLDMGQMSLNDHETDSSSTATTSVSDGVESESRSGSESGIRDERNSGSQAGVVTLCPLGVEYRWHPKKSPSQRKEESPRPGLSHLSPTHPTGDCTLSPQVSPTASHSPFLLYSKSPRQKTSRKLSPGLSPSSSSSRSSTSKSSKTRSSDRLSPRGYSPSTSPPPGHIFPFSPLTSPRTSPRNPPHHKSPGLHRISPGVSPPQYSPQSRKSLFSPRTSPRNIPIVHTKDPSPQHYYIPPLPPLAPAPELPSVAPPAPTPNLACVGELKFLCQPDSSKGTGSSSQRPTRSRHVSMPQKLSPGSVNRLQSTRFPRRKSPRNLLPHPFTSHLQPLPHTLPPHEEPPSYQARSSSPSRSSARSRGRSSPDHSSRSASDRPFSEAGTSEDGTRPTDNFHPSNLATEDFSPSKIDKPQQGTRYRAYECGYCRATFSRRAKLEEHQRLHFGDQNFVCGSENFTSHSKPKARKEEGNYKCSRCDMNFRRSSHLKDHLRTHSGEKFKCHKCRETFRDSDLLQQHLDFYFHDLPILCLICDKEFDRQDLYLFHMMDHPTRGEREGDRGELREELREEGCDENDRRASI